MFPEMAFRHNLSEVILPSYFDMWITELLYVFFRHLSSCGILDTRRASLPPPAASSQVVPTRNFINLSAPLITRRMEYLESRALRYVHTIDKIQSSSSIIFSFNSVNVRLFSHQLLAWADIQRCSQCGPVPAVCALVQEVKGHEGKKRWHASSAWNWVPPDSGTLHLWGHGYPQPPS